MLIFTIFLFGLEPTATFAQEASESGSPNNSDEMDLIKIPFKTPGPDDRKCGVCIEQKTIKIETINSPSSSSPPVQNYPQEPQIQGISIAPQSPTPQPTLQPLVKVLPKPNSKASSSAISLTKPSTTPTSTPSATMSPSAWVVEKPQFSLQFIWKWILKVLKWGIDKG